MSNPKVNNSDRPASSAPPENRKGQAARTQKLLHAPVGKTLLELAAPMALGIAAIVLFTVVDTYFVGQLGPKPLAAMSFCFPVNFIVFSVTMGLGIGTTSVIARAIGDDNHREVRRVTTHALILAVLVVVAVGGAGILAIDPLFSAMGAKPEVLPMIRAYMTPWFSGVGLLVIPMVGNSAIRATGDTKSPSIIMMVAGLTNVALDPIFIFGWGPIPRMELQGAALATVTSWGCGFIAAMYLLAVRERLIVWSVPKLAQVWKSWKAVLFVGLPAAATNLLIPLSTGILTRLVSGYGLEAVAAFGVSTRLEALAMIGINALSTALTPFVGQNYGAATRTGRYERLHAALRFSIKASLLWGLGGAIILGAFAPQLAGLFADKDAIVGTATLYLRLIPFSYGLLGIGMLINTFFIALGKPLAASIVVAIRLFVLALPLAFVGAMIADLPGLFVGIALGNAVLSVVAVAMLRRALGSLTSRPQLQG